MMLNYTERNSSLSEITPKSAFSAPLQNKVVQIRCYKGTVKKFSGGYTKSHVKYLKHYLKLQ